MSRRAGPLPLTGTARTRRAAPATLLATLATLLALAAAAPPALAQDDGGEPDPPPVAASSLAADLEGLLWIDRSSALLATGATAVAVAPGSPPTLYAGGRGFVVRSLDEGLTWQAVLLLHGAELATTAARGPDEPDDDPIFLRVEDDDLERLEDTEILERFEELRDETLDELIDLYGEDLAEEIVQDLEDDLREEALSEFLDALGPDSDLDDPLAADDDSVSARLEHLRDLGIDDEARARVLDDPLVVHELLVPPDAPDTVYAATGRGLFRSPDAGRTWQLLIRGAGLDDHGVLCVAVGPGGQRILAGTLAGLTVSDDAGRTWSAPVGVLAGVPILQLAGGLNNAATFIAVSVREMQRSDDGGLTWSTLVPTDFDPHEVRELLAVGGWSETFLTATTRGAFRSDDRGTTWTDLSDGLPARELVDLVLPDAGDPDLLLALDERRAMASLDAGATWLDVSSGLLGQRLIAGASGGSAQTLWLATESGAARGLLGVEAALEAETVRQLQELWASEPTPAQTIAAALLYASLDDIPADAWTARQFSARFLPRVFGELEVRTTRYDREYVDFETATPEPDPGIESLTLQRRLAEPRTFLDWQVYALWDIGELVYDSDEHAIERTEQTLVRSRNRLVARLVRLFIARRALQLRVAAESASGTDLRRRLDATLQLEESTALLDALTGGYFIAASAARATSRPPP